MLKPLRSLAVLGFCGLVAFALAAAAHDQQDAKAKESKVQPKKGVITDPKEGGIDYLVMGEYVGTMEGGQKLGCQVIALGNGYFQAVVLPGGLPGEGWDGTNRILMDGSVEGDKTTFIPTAGKRRYLAGSPKELSATAKFPPVGQKDYKAVVVNQVMKGTTDEGKSFELKKTMRHEQDARGQAARRGHCAVRRQKCRRMERGQNQGWCVAGRGEHQTNLQGFQAASRVRFAVPTERPRPGSR